MSETANEPLTRTRKRRLRLYFLIAALSLLVIYVALETVSRQRLNAAIGRVEQRVGSLAVQRIGAPEVPAEENRARLVRAATALTTPATREAMSGINALGSPREGGPIPDVVSAFVAANQSALTLSTQFRTRQKSDWEVDYSTGSNMPSLIEVRTLGNAIMLSAVLELEAGRVDEAAVHVANGLAVSASLRHEPNLITQLIRIAVASRQIDGVQRLLAHGNASRASLEMLAAALAENRAPSPMTAGMTGEVKLIHGQFAAISAGRANGLADGPHPFGSSKLLARIGRPLLLFRHGSYLDTMDAILDSQLGPRPRREVPPETNSFLANQFMPGVTAGLARALLSGDDHDSEIAAAETAVALCRYKLDKGEYPADLSALAPQYLTGIPIDPFTGQPPVYAREGGGFTLMTQRYGPRAKEVRPTPEWKVKPGELPLRRR